MYHFMDKMYVFVCLFEVLHSYLLFSLLPYTFVCVYLCTSRHAYMYKYVYVSIHKRKSTLPGMCMKVREKLAGVSSPLIVQVLGIELRLPSLTASALTR